MLAFFFFIILGQVMRIIWVSFIVILFGLFGVNAQERFITEDASVIAFINANLIDGTGRAAKAGQTVIVRDGNIDAIGASISVPVDAKVIDLNGKTLMPGLVQLHEHLFYTADETEFFLVSTQPVQFPRLYLAGGITTARTAGSFEPYTDLRVKEAIEAGRLAGPDFDLTAPYLEGKPGAVLQLHTLDSAEEAREMVRYWAGQGFTSVKGYTNITREQLGAAIDEAHNHNMKVTGHLCSVTFREAADLGIDQFAHGFFVATDFVKNKEPDVCPSGRDQFDSLIKTDPDGAEAQALFKHLVEKGTSVTATLAVLSRWVPETPPLPAWGKAILDDDTLAAHLQRRESALSNAQRIDASRKRLEAAARMNIAFWRAGGKLVVGSDTTSGGGVLPGHANARTMEMLVRYGMPALDVIKAATLLGAETMGLDADRGSIEVGKRADMIIIDGDPSVDMADMHKVVTVFKRGIGYDTAAMRDAARGKVGAPG